MHRATLAAGIALLIAIPLGGVGAWAFNPDSGAMLHSEVLWRTFGIMFEGGLLLLIELVTASVLLAGLRQLVTTSRSHHA